MARIILLLAILLQAWIIRCTPANYTIDDTTGDARAQNLPFYLPQGSWSNNCTECDMQPEAQNASNGTYTQTRDNVNISNPAYINIDFEGTAIYLFFILGNELPSGSITTNITIRLDRQEYTFSRNSTQGTGFFEYDQLVFAKDTLPNTNHTLSIDVYSVLAFDRAVYTFDEDLVSTDQPSTDDSTTPDGNPDAKGSQTPIGAIVGGVLGGVVAIVALVGSIVLIVRRRRRKAKSSFTEMGKFRPPYSTNTSQSRSATPLSRAEGSYPMKRSSFGSYFVADGGNQDHSSPRPSTSQIGVGSPSSTSSVNLLHQSRPL